MPICETLAHRELTKLVPFNFYSLALYFICFVVVCLSLQSDYVEAKQVERCVRAAALRFLLFPFSPRSRLSSFPRSFPITVDTTNLTRQFQGDSSRASRRALYKSLTLQLLTIAEPASSPGCVPKNRDSPIVVVIVFDSPLFPRPSFFVSSVSSCRAVGSRGLCSPASLCASSFFFTPNPCRLATYWKKQHRKLLLTRSSFFFLIPSFNPIQFIDRRLARHWAGFLFQIAKQKPKETKKGAHQIALKFNPRSLSQSTKLQLFCDDFEPAIAVYRFPTA